MPTNDPSDREPSPADPADRPDDPSGYEPPSEFDEPRALAGPGHRRRPVRGRVLARRAAPRRSASGADRRRPRRSSAWWPPALLGYRAYHRAKVLAEGTAIAEAALRLDTAAGYRKAADTLEPLARLDPREAASMRAFALAMLASDYREAELGGEAEALIAAPGRADKVPAYADLAAAALFLGRGAVGDAATYAGRAGESPWSGALLARLALLAGNPEAGFEPLRRSLAADPRPGRRRWPCRATWPAASTTTSTPPAPPTRRPWPPPASTRAPPTASPSWRWPRRFPSTRPSRRSAPCSTTPRPRRATSGRAPRSTSPRSSCAPATGPRPRPRSTPSRGSTGAARAWAELAVLIAASDRKGYRAVKGPPPLFVSASDDDPLEAPAVDPTPPPGAAQGRRQPAKKPAAKPVKKAPPPAKKAPARKPPPGRRRRTARAAAGRPRHRAARSSGSALPCG